MTDESDGGGEMTGNEIISGEHNSIFPDVSDLDRAYGVVNIRSVHAAVKSALAETYFGATVGVLKQPDDPNVSITLMSQNSPYVMRDESRNVIESYLARGVKWQGELMYDQLKGSRSIRLIQRIGIKLPVSGEVLVATDKQTGNEQFVKIVNVQSALQSFSYPGVPDFTRRVVTCEISEPLRYTFKGVEPSPYDPISSNSACYETMVADAAKYYSVKPLREDAQFAANEVTVPSVYNQLVPSALIETAHVNKPIVDTMEITIKSNSAGTRSVLAPVSLESQLLQVTKENQGYVYTQTLVPTPSLGTVIVSYMVQGKWYELRDRGDGVLEGFDESYGTGQLDEFGNIAITLGALPDVDSPILYQWANTSITTRLITDIAADAGFNVNLPSYPQADTLTITWDDKMATVSNNIISGDAAGVVRGRKVSLIPNALPPVGTAYQFDWTNKANNNSYNLPLNPSNNKLTFTLDGSTDISPNSVEINYPVSPAGYLVTDGRENFQDEFIQVHIIDDGSGNLTYNGNAVGTIDYQTRECVINTGFNVEAIAIEWTKNRLSFYGQDTYKRTKLTTVTVMGEIIALPHHINIAYTNINIGSEVGTHIETPVSINVNIQTGGFNVMASSLEFILAGLTYTTIGNTLYAGNSSRNN